MWIAPNKDHYNLQTADRFEGIEVHQNGSIIIHQVQRNDSGDYICVATSNKKSVQAKTHLTIHDRPKSVPKLSTMKETKVKFSLIYYVQVLFYITHKIILVIKSINEK